MDRNIRTIFAEKVHGHDDLEIVSSKTIAYLKWLIYIAAFKDEKHRSLIDDSQFYVAQCKTLEAAEFGSPCICSRKCIADNYEL